MKNRINGSIVICVFFIALLLSSCQPRSREAYLEAYKEFIVAVREDGQDYEESDWQEADEEYDEFSGELYDTFESELTVKDKLQIASWGIQYNALKGTKTVNDLVDFMIDDEDGLLTFFQDEYKDDAEGLAENLKKKMDHYRENEMEDDLNTLMETIKSVSDSIPELQKLLSY
jgi:hypothetical protein